LNGKSEQADNMVIASGTSNRHVASIAEKLISSLKKELGLRVKTEGMGNSDWILIDCGDVVIHVFREEVRDFYQLERLWQHNPSILPDFENA
jgi:ribosome-associated protein